MHLVHKPTLRTPDSSAGESTVTQLYDDNISYMDKQVGALVDELEKDGLRNNTLIIFSGDNGTAAGYPSPVHGRMLNGWKGSMLEGGSRVPFIASWPGVTPAGKVLDDIVSFADPYATFAELAGAKLSDTIKTDGQSLAPQLRGQTGNPRKWAYVQLGEKWYVREPGFKLNESGDLFDMSDAPFVEKPIAPQADTDQSKAARQRLAAALTELNPAAGKTDREGGGANRVAANAPRSVGPWKTGDTLPGPRPLIAGKPLEISAEVDATGSDGVIVSQGGAAEGSPSTSPAASSPSPSASRKHSPPSSPRTPWAPAISSSTPRSTPTARWPFSSAKPRSPPATPAARSPFNPKAP